ncbi:N-acetylmuramoyl-L-alanine amidase family protein [Bacillus pseudomycoides]|uniref:N-acetylmuramoyl-L-alanine amidase family protein n=1 Tax=Bacillus pseudomycoides TaxID=64104 RepID=UPI002FFE4D09
MRKFIGIILSLVLLCSTYAPSLTLAAETANKVGWVKEDGAMYYYEKPGVKRTNSITLDGIEYNFGKDGKLLFGTKWVNDKSVYYEEPGKLKTGWMNSLDEWEYFDNGLPITGTLTCKGKKFEFNKYGEMEKGWITLRSTIKRVYPKPETKFLFESKPVKEGEILEVVGKQGLWYRVKYHGEIGYVRIFESVVIDQTPITSFELVQGTAMISHFLLTGYKKDPEKFFPANIDKAHLKRFDSDVKAFYDLAHDLQNIKSSILLDNKTSWVQENGKWYYYQKNGNRVTGSQTIDDKQYYFGSDGAMQTGWVNLGGTKKYYSPSGVMQVGIQYIDGKMYYFNEGGQLSTGIHFINGKPYYFDTSHESKSGWMKNEYDWYLLHPSGALQTKDFTYKDKKFSFNEDGEMVKGWIVLESLVKKVYPEPDLKHVLRAKHVQSGEIIEVTGKIGPWYEVNYHGEKGYVRIHDAIIFDQEAKNPLTLLDGKLKIFEGVLNYLKSDETLVNDTFKVLEDLDHNTTDSIENWNNISKEIDNAKQDVQYKIVVVKEARDKLQEIVNSIKGDIKNLTVTQRNELRKLIGQDAINITNDMLKSYNFLLQSTVAYYENLSVLQDKTNEFLKDMSDVIVEIGENNRKLHEMFKNTGALQDLGKIAESSIRLKKSVEVAKPKMEELARKTQETVPVIAGHLQTLQEKVPGFYTDVNTGLDFANAFMDSANKIASHKVDIPGTARNIGNIDLSNSLRDFGVSPEKINEYIAEQNATNNFMNTTLDIMPILNVPKEAIQMYQGKEIGTDRKYGPSDYAMGVLSVATGGTVKTIGKVVGTVADLEKKAKNLEKATQGTSGIGWSMPRGGGVINGRKYSEHALERMAPDTVEIRAELNTRAREMAAKKGYKPGTAEYEALFAKIDPRGMTPNVVEDIIKNGSRSPGGKPGTWKYSREDGYVIINDKGDVVTVVPAKKK